MKNMNILSTVMMICILLLGNSSSVMSFTPQFKSSTSPLVEKMNIFKSTSFSMENKMVKSTTLHNGPPPSSSLTTERMTNKASASATTMLVTIMMTQILPTVANAVDDVEIAELPPVWVPILFAIGILGGVGLLTSSLGDVMTEEASLGLMSGAKAKKEKERSRSSYFKNPK